MEMAATNLQKVLGMLAFYGRFSLSFTEIGYQVRRLAWPKLKPDFSRQHWLVSGATAGLGRELTLSAAAAGADVTAAARDQTKLQALVGMRSHDEHLQSGDPGLHLGLHPECCDFTSLSDTQALLDRLAVQGQPVDVLVNNIGVLNAELTLSREGLEASFVSNLLSHYQLTEGLIERGLLRPGSVIINMTSGGAYMAPLRIAALNVTEPARYNGMLAYAMHKRGQIALNEYWRERYGHDGLEFYVMHPGWADTAGVQRSLPGFRKLYRPILRDARSGVDTALWLAATRPTQPSGPCLWFDRKPRNTHVFALTRQGDSTDSLVRHLQSLLQSVPQKI
jgi:dehydrogenase/reductase SDR family protein 12